MADIQLINDQWNPFPHRDGYSIFPAFRKFDIFCSNSFIVQTPHQIVVIDPGGEDRQIDRIADAVQDAIRENPRPVFIYLTHCHIDHGFKTSALLSHPGFRSCLFVHEAGATALAGKNKEIILLYLFNAEMQDIGAAVPLFSEEDRRRTGSFPLILPGIDDLGTSSSIHRDDRDFYSQKIYYKDDTITVYHAPGHSPDSICIQIDDLLFVGDLPFAANPLVAGIKGWNPDDYIVSLTNVIGLLREKPFSMILSGHGNVSGAAAMERVLSGILAEAQNLAALPELNEKSLRDLFEYSKLLLDEAQRLFTIVSGRLYKVGYFLDTLEESEEAERLERLIDFEEIDRFMTSLNTLREEYENDARKPEMFFLFRYLMFLRKLRELFDPKRVSGLIDDGLLRRASNLLIDFFNTVRGFRYENLCADEDLNGIVVTLTADLKTSVHEGDDIMESLEDKEAFVKQLSRRIAYEPIFAHVAFDLSLGESLPKVFIEPSIFQDLLTSLFESLAVRKAERISIQTRADSGKVRMTITPHFKEPSAFSRTRHIEYLRRTLENYNIRFVIPEGASPETYEMEFGK